MTREDAISELQPCVNAWDKWMLPGSPSLDRYKEAVRMALAALRAPTREQVEKMRGEWVNWEDGVCCSICETERLTKSGTIKFSSRLMRFCPYCGSPMTDEAVDILLKRFEALYEIPTAT